MRRALVADVHRVAPQRAPGYLEDCLRLGKVTRDGRWVVFDEESHRQLRAKYNPGMIAAAQTRPEPRLPAKGRMMLNAAGAAVRAGKAKIKKQPVLNTLEEGQARIHGCQTSGPDGGPCEFYRPSDMRCGHKKSGCFLDPERLTPIPAKTRLVTEHCPLTPAVW